MKKIPSPDEEMKIMECGLSAWKMQGIVSSLSICNWGFKHFSKKSCVPKVLRNRLQPVKFITQ